MNTCHAFWGSHTSVFLCTHLDLVDLRSYTLMWFGVCVSQTTQLLYSSRDQISGLIFARKMLLTLSQPSLLSPLSMIVDVLNTGLFLFLDVQCLSLSLSCCLFIHATAYHLFINALSCVTSRTPCFGVSKDKLWTFRRTLICYWEVNIT